MLDNDIVADLQPDGRYVIRRWRAVDGRLVPITGHGDAYDEAEMLRRLGELRSSGDTYVRKREDVIRLIES